MLFLLRLSLSKQDQRSLYRPTANSARIGHPKVSHSILGNFGVNIDPQWFVLVCQKVGDPHSKCFIVKYRDRIQLAMAIACWIQRRRLTLTHPNSQPYATISAFLEPCNRRFLFLQMGKFQTDGVPLECATKPWEFLLLGS
ncbi:hypothetical protein Zmor_001666 [Zophobas morio]|uniref:Uncharacterized protein n=1 Tax=Zophobas morio TaxID=2755281 RepID=A0AA38J2Y6_9CUCU|nr:hypothetical protein Zmor_001666 [Zophobas morio]